MGMESTLKNSFMLTIFIVSILTFAVMFAIDNDSDISISGDTRFDGLTSDLKDDASALEQEAESSRTILMKTTLETGDEHAGSGGQFKVGPFTAIGMSLKGMTAGFKTIFGGDSDETNPFTFIIISFATLMSFLIGYYVIKAWLGRDPS